MYVLWVQMQTLNWIPQTAPVYYVRGSHTLQLLMIVKQILFFLKWKATQKYINVRK